MGRRKPATDLRANMIRWKYYFRAFLTVAGRHRGFNGETYRRNRARGIGQNLARAYHLWHKRMGSLRAKQAKKIADIIGHGAEEKVKLPTPPVTEFWQNEAEKQGEEGEDDARWHEMEVRTRESRQIMVQNTERGQKKQQAVIHWEKRTCPQTTNPSLVFAMEQAHYNNVRPLHSNL
ncbi:hypothetical protein J4Q44_G00019460 [Coregonus suidteri]|uniref:Uncharacterized protein n=1 Tax=Coregonus suidteri TaxID=861788 RepID=A0AAN8R5R5_9TELE